MTPEPTVGARVVRRHKSVGGGPVAPPPSSTQTCLYLAKRVEASPETRLKQPRPRASAAGLQQGDRGGAPGAEARARANHLQGKSASPGDFLRGNSPSLTSSGSG